MSNRYREALAHLTYGVEDGGGFVLLTGEVGTGKTTVCRCLLQQLPDKTRLAFVLNPKLNSIELLATICDELDISYPENCNSLKILTDRLSQYLLECYEQGLSVVVMIDEAQNIETEVLEQIRLLTNLETNQKKLLQIILVGQPELQEKLAQRELRQLAQRITARYHLRPLSLKETMAYVLHRVRIAGSRKSLFDRASIELLHQKTAGIPRLINTICDRALVAAKNQNKNQVNKKLIQKAINDVMGGASHLEPVNLKPNTTKWLMVIVTIAVIGLISFSFWLGQRSSSNNVATINNQPLSESNNNISVQRDSSVEKSQEVVNKKDESVQWNNISLQDNSLVDRMLDNERWDSSGQLSMQGLLSIWNISYSPMVDGLSCQFAATYGLLCESNKGNWQQLRELNRAVNLKFTAGLQGEFWGTLTALSGMEASLKFGDRNVKVGLDELSTIWTGDYTFLWQAPPNYRGDMKLGDNGGSVKWLSEKLNQLVDEKIAITSQFDFNIEQALKAYQQQRHIVADGIAGMKTILMLNGDTIDGIPLLQSN